MTDRGRVQRLSELMSRVPGSTVWQDAVVSGVSYDTRTLVPGDVFFAIAGFQEDGSKYTPQALAKGASAIVVREGVECAPGPGGFATVPDVRKALSRASSVFYGDPSRELLVVGVTGTKGKTTTTHLLADILAYQGHRTGLVGTVHNVVGNETMPSTRTTPESLDLQAMLRGMVWAGDRAAVMEVSSHALSLCRVEDIRFDVAALTNIGRDHLDFHGSMDAYVEAKAGLFDLLEDGGTAVVNADEAYSAAFRTRAKGRVVEYGVDAQGALVRARDISLFPGGISFVLVLGHHHRSQVTMRLPGRFNVSNALCAAAAAWALGADSEGIAQGLCAAKPVKGRVEVIEGETPFSVWVDYAHTPESLRGVLALAKEVSPGKVIAVFGCGGDRDKGKRALMGQISGEIADITIITDDNPRSEPGEQILADIASGFKGPGTLVKMGDRKKAIGAAIGLGSLGDVIVIAGKGHETYQIIGQEVVPFDDSEVARAAMLALGRERPKT